MTLHLPIVFTLISLGNVIIYDRPACFNRPSESPGIVTMEIGRHGSREAMACSDFMGLLGDAVFQRTMTLRQDLPERRRMENGIVLEKTLIGDVCFQGTEFKGAQKPEAGKGVSWSLHHHSVIQLFLLQNMYYYYITILSVCGRKTITQKLFFIHTNAQRRRPQ